MRILPLFRASNEDYDLFTSKIGDTDIMHGIDNQVCLTDDEAYELVNSVWQDVSATSNTKEDSLFSFIKYLELIRAQAKGFVYQLAEDYVTKKDVVKKELLGDE